MASDPRKIMELGARRGDDVEPLLSDLGHCDIALDTAPWGAHLREDHATDGGGQFVGAEAVEETPRSGSGDLVLGEARLIENADARSNGDALLADGAMPVSSAKRVLVSCRVDMIRATGKPEWALPPESRAVHGSFRQQSIVERTRLQGATRGALFFRVVYGVLEPVDLRRTFRNVLRRARVFGEAAHVELPHVVAGLPVHDPLGRVFTGAAREDDAEDAEASQDMEVGNARQRPHEAKPVGRIGIGPVDDGLDPRVPERRHPLGSGGEHILEPIEIGWKQLAVKVFGDSRERPRLGVAFECTDEQSVDFGSNVEGGIGISKNGQLGLRRAYRFDILGDDEVMLKGNDREFDADHATDLICPLARGIDDDLGSDVALRCPNQPGATISLDRGHRRVPEDLGSRGSGSLRQRLRDAARIDVAVGRDVSRADDALQVDEREELPSSLGRDHLERDA